MFSLEQIAELHARLGKAQTLADHARALRAIGIERYDSYLTDGHSEYFGRGGVQLSSPPTHEKLTIAHQSNDEEFLNHLKRHGQGQTTYLEMSRGLAASGIEKWTIDTNEMTVIYCNRAGTVLLFEPL